MINEDDLKLPKANLITAINGDENAFKSILDDNSSEKFDGYIKVSMKIGTIPANGVVVLLSGKAGLAYFQYHNDKLFGQDALPRILNITKSRKCVLKLYSFPSDVKKNINTIAESLADCRIDIEDFWNSDPSNMVQKENGEEEGRVMTRPQIDDVMEDAGDAFKAIVGEGIVVIEGKEERVPTPIDDDKIDKVEEALKGREEKIRREILKKLEEREELKLEEEKFLKMDEVFSRLLKEREEERKRKEDELDQVENDLNVKIGKKEKALEHKEEEIQKEMDTLNKEREEMKVREKKLQEMEKMFRRVLANTEDRLKKKEEELILKEEELKIEVSDRMRLIEDLKLREARVLEMEQQISASNAGDEIVNDEIKHREKHIKALEEDLRSAKEELERTCEELEAGKQTNDDIVTCLKVLDDLLGKLPDEIITEFSTSEGFEIYEKIMRHFKLVKD